MNAKLGWLLAAGAVVVGTLNHGWPGLVFALSVVAFWLLLQFSRALRVLKNAGAAPVGHVPSAVMLQARLKRGMTLMQIVAMTKSLGRKVAETPETWAWADDGEAQVTVVIEDGRLARWALSRPSADANAADPAE